MDTRNLLSLCAETETGYPARLLLKRDPLVAPKLQNASKRGWLLFVNDRWKLTEEGRKQLTEPESQRQEKSCPACKNPKPRQDYWLCSATQDGLYYCCITCANRKREMEEQREVAIQIIHEAAEIAVLAAQEWDEGIAKLTHAWEALMQVDQVVRDNRSLAGSECDFGRLEARLLAPRATYALGMALLTAKYPWPAPCFHMENWTLRLSDFVGTDPSADYVPPPKKRGRPKANTAPQEQQSAELS